MIEEWKTLRYNGIEYPLYSISNTAKIKSNKTGTIYKTNISKSHGYEQFSIYIKTVYNSKTGRKDKVIHKNIQIHKAVAEAFIPNPNNLPVVNHKDGIKLNNLYTNLEWVTYQENCIHASVNGLLNIKAFSGENNGCSKLSNEDVKYIRTHYIKYSHNKSNKKELAKKFNVTGDTILNIIRGNTYKIVQ